MSRINRSKIIKKCIILDKRCRNFRCGSYNDLSAHHIISRAQGGPDELWNLITLCFECHRKITDNEISIIEILDRLYNSRDFRWGRAYKYWIRREKNG